MNKYLKEIREDSYKILSIVLFFLFIVSGWYIGELRTENKQLKTENVTLQHNVNYLDDIYTAVENIYTCHIINYDCVEKDTINDPLWIKQARDRENCVCDYSKFYN